MRQGEQWEEHHGISVMGYLGFYFEENEYWMVSIERDMT